ncbi:unnamed protein product [Brassica rapa subsp. trilocularis]
MVSLGSTVKMMLMLFVRSLMILEFGLRGLPTELRSLIFLLMFLIRLVVIPMFLNWLRKLNLVITLQVRWGCFMLANLT